MYCAVDVIICIIVEEKRIKVTKLVYPQIYSYTLPEEPDNDGSQKIGYTERRDVDKRIYEQTHTAAKHLKFEKQWSSPAFFADGKTSFVDKTFHRFLIKNGIENRLDLGIEWFYFNGTPEKSRELFNNFKQHGFAALQASTDKIPYTLRTEQENAVIMAHEYFNTHENGEFLWNAKPRFGKTLASYDLAKRLNAKKVLIVTNRPAIANSWFDDYEMFVEGYHFISETSSLSERKTINRDQYNQLSIKKPFIAFLSLQDLKGSKYFGGSLDKLAWIADLEWDLLIIDEAHEGIDTSRTDSAFDVVKRAHTLHLSGTPFKQLANNKFSKEAIFNWTYLDEQKIKKAELAEGEVGDHTDLPDLKLYTYRISQMTVDEVNEGIEIDDDTRDYAFDLNEFFATQNQQFIHENDVRNFLKNLTTNLKYPFSTPELRNELKHTFWYVGNRVDSVKALAELLKQDDTFGHGNYKIIIAAGDGKSFDDEEADFKGNEKSFDKVKKAIAENDKTITLSCGQLTTGVTVKEWSAVLMLTDIKSTPQYMQAAFRAQNPYRYTENGEFKAKESAYLFDFAPTRVLEMYDEFANGLNPKATEGKITEGERKDNIKELLNYFPVISEDTNGQMIELDAEKVLTLPNALASVEIVKARFMTNLLFNDNIKGVFHFPKVVEDIFDKMPKEKNKRPEVSKTKLNLDDARKVELGKQKLIDENRDVILGEKIYSNNIDRLVDNAISYETPEETLETLPGKVEALAEPLIAKYKTTYQQTTSQTEELAKEIKEKINLAVAEYETSDIKDAEKLKADLTEAIEVQITDKIEQQETQKVEEVQKSKEDEVREHLRAFTRTIPMFIMANSATHDITIDNFDTDISDEDFIDLTNITKDEFHMLRDGFDYTEYSEAEGREVQKYFGGVFDKYRFNASISEFLAEKIKRANYFDESIKDDIFELIPNQKNNQIFTQKKVVTMMIDSLERESPEIFLSPDSTFIDLYMKSGMYITEIVKRLVANTQHLYDSRENCVKYILEHQVYGLAPTGVLNGITNAYIFGFDESNDISRHNFTQYDLLPNAKEGTVGRKLAELFNGGNDMKFTAVVGNPPYNESRDDTRDDAIYNYFYDTAKQIAPLYCLISPARFLFNAGSTDKKWNRVMLSDEHIKVTRYEQNSSRIFPNTDIKGGVAILLRDQSNTFGAIGTFTSFEELNSIIHKVDPMTEITIDTIMSGQGVYRFTKKMHSDHPEVRGILSKSHPDDVGTGVLETLHNILFFSVKPDNNNDYTQILGRYKNDRVYHWIRTDYINKPSAYDKYRVVLPKANGTGAIGEVLSTPLIGEPLIGEPLIGFTQTFISIGAFDNEVEARNALKYVKSKFARTMLGVLKITQDNPKDKWQKVPLQNFTATSDIDWTKSIPEIDQQLYRKYNLSPAEIAFIESKVKAME